MNKEHHNANKAKLLCRIGLYVGLEDESDLEAAILKCILIKGSKLSGCQRKEGEGKPTLDIDTFPIPL